MKGSTLAFNIFLRVKVRYSFYSFFTVKSTFFPSQRLVGSFLIKNSIIFSFKKFCNSVLSPLI